MRPLELTIQGFKSYDKEQTFSFDGRSLFAIVGPIGSGKSTILDAIVFALYGKTPRLERDTKKLINSACDEARVQLVFESDGVSWEVSRALRNKGQPPNILRRYGEDAVESSGAAAVTDRVQELLGLDFDAFCSSVVLPQGEFDRFLGATPGVRSRVLKGIFRLERVDELRDAARRQAAQMTGLVSGLESELASLLTDRAIVERLMLDLQAARDLAIQIREALSQAAKAERELERVEENLADLDRRMAEAAAMLDELPDAADLEKLAADEEAISSIAQSAEKRLSATSVAVDKAEVALERAEQETGGDAAIGKARDLVRDLARLSKEEESVSSQGPALEKALESAERLVDRDTQLAASAGALALEARKRVEAIRHQHSAHLLRKELVSGHPCPVCGQDVARIPTAGRAPALRSAEDFLAKSEAKVDAARAALDRAQRDRTLANERLSNWSTTAKKITEQVQGARNAITRLLGKVKDPAIQVERREALLKTARAQLDSARAELSQAETGARMALRKVAEVAAMRNRQAATLNRVCGALRISPPDADAEATGLLDAAKRAADAAVLQIETDNRRHDEVSRLAESFAQTLTAYRKRYDLSDEEPVARALEKVTESIGSIQSEIENTKKAIARAAEIDKEMADIRKQRDLYERLGKDLTDAGFVGFLLHGQRRLLSRIGSEKLFELTGHYRFDEDGEFTILDHRSTKSRTADTLSGGETFLASLALALALAEAVSQEGGRLECFFLDEGFGSLDAESLDLALEGIEALAAPGRLIGLISHVTGIQARLDDLIVLDKGEDGTTRVIQHEGPISYPPASI